VGEAEVKPDALEEARAIAKQNAEYNAQIYRQMNPRFTVEHQIVSRSDTAQTEKCPQGDGWAQVSIMKVDGKSVDKTSLMCSTYSASVGCFRAEDFVKDKIISTEDGVCNAKLRFPIKPLVK
jgi:exosome complex RNA-binding protein Csl4